MSETAPAPTPDFGTQAHRDAAASDLASKIASGAFGAIPTEEGVPGTTEGSPSPAPAAETPPNAPQADTPPVQRDPETGKFKSPNAEPAAAPAPETKTPTVSSGEDGTIVLKGPWGERKLDPQKAEDRAALIEFGQKGANYERLVADMDNRATKRAEQLAEQRLFEQYLAAGLIEVDATGATRYTAKGLATFAPQSSTQAPAPTPDEIDSLIREAVSSDDQEKAVAALRTAFQKSRLDPTLVKRLVDSQFQEREQAAAAARAQAEVQQRVRARFDSELEKHPIVKAIPGGPDYARQLVLTRLEEIAGRQRAGDPTAPQGDAAFEVALAEVSRLATQYQGIETAAVQKYAKQAATPVRAAPPATGGGSAAPPAGVAQQQARPGLYDRGKQAFAASDVARMAKQLLGK